MSSTTTLSELDRRKVAGALSKRKHQRAIAELLSRLDDRAATYRAAIAGARDPGLREYAAMALAALDGQRQAAIGQALAEEPAALDDAIDALDSRLR